MKLGMDLFCASPASTAICSKSSIDQPKNQPQPHHHRNIHVPCSSDDFPFNPKPLYEKCRKSFSSKQSSHHHDIQLRRKSSADIHDLIKFTDTPAVPIIDWFASEEDHHASAALLPHSSKPKRRLITSNAQYSSSGSSALRSSSTRSHRHQVVVLRVSLHCKGCEGKVRKHLSKMEGVTSFSIDFSTKKVTVIGDVTPLGVLASVSKVKNAQLWPSATSSPSSSPWSS